MYWNILPRVENSKNPNIHYNTNPWGGVQPIAPLEVFCKDFADVSFESALFVILHKTLYGSSLSISRVSYLFRVAF